MDSGSIIGKRFTRLVVLEQIPNTKNYKCLCDCGNTSIVNKSNLKRVKSCGCWKSEIAKLKVVDLIGKVFGRLTVISRAGSSARNSTWNCLCQCGNTTIVPSNNFRNSNTSSCGCYRAEQQTVHGMTGSPLYSTWEGIVQRTTNPNSEGYSAYGGRGIKMCAEWRNDFLQFQKDMGDKPTVHHTVERLDNNGNYEASNCRWATQKEQGNNRSNNRHLTYLNETKTLTQWSEQFGIIPRTLTSRIDTLGWSVEKAITTPVNTKFSSIKQYN